MSHRRPRRSRVCRPGLEVLEGRWVPAQFGVPWHDPKHLTVSFVPDGTSIAGQPSDLFQALDAQEPTPDWQREILQAFQTWAVQANIYFAVTPDSGQPLGVPGPDQHDPRFGDIRIGAIPLPPDVLSVSIPHDPFLSGTWSGDILLNSTIAFDGENVSLLPVLLHEVGHVLGLDHSADPASVMSSHLNNQQVRLAPSDIAAVQDLYGPRLDDPFERPLRNDSIPTATPFPAPDGFDGSTPLLLYANLATARDVDVFSLKPPAGYRGPLTIRLQTAGVSLLAPHLTVTDATGKTLGDLSSVGDNGDTLQLTIPQVDPDTTYYLMVRAATDDLFGTGEYVLAASFDARSVVGPDAIDTLARQSYSYLSPEDLEAIFLDPRGALFHQDHHADDTFETAAHLYPIGAYGSEAPDRITASLGDPTDVDFYRIETPEESYDDTPDRPLVMTVTGRATEVNGLMPRVSVFDQDRDPVPALVLAHGDGTFTIQVADARPDADYFIRVSSDPTSGKVVGNYDLDVEFGHEASTPAEFVGATLDDPDRPPVYALLVHQTQLFDFLLTATSAAATPGINVRMAITDDAGQVVATRTADLGDTAGGDPVLLVPGVYLARFTAETPDGAPPPPIAFRLYGASLSDPIGPALDDPTLKSVSDAATLGPSAAVPPVIGSSSDAFTWLALTLAVPRDPSTLSLGPTVPGRIAQREGVDSQDGSALSRIPVAGLSPSSTGRTSGNPDGRILLDGRVVDVLGLGVAGGLFGQAAVNPRASGALKDSVPGRDAAFSASAGARPAQALSPPVIAITALVADTPPNPRPLDELGDPVSGLQEDRVPGTGLVASRPIHTTIGVMPPAGTRSSHSQPRRTGRGPQSLAGRWSRAVPGPPVESSGRGAWSTAGFDPAAAAFVSWVAALVYGCTRRRDADGVRRFLRRAGTSRLAQGGRS